MFALVRLVFVLLLFGIPAALIGLPLTLLRHDVGWMYRAGQLIAGWAMRFAGIRFDVQGRENIPYGHACIYMANHVSNLDPTAVLHLLPNTPTVMVKRSIFRIPLLGPAMRLGRFVPVDQQGSRRSAMQSAKEAAENLRDGLPLFIFVEGTRSRDGRLLPFKRGPFHLAQAAGVPIIPVAIMGTEQMMQKGSAAIHPGTAHIRFLPAILPSSYPDRSDLLQAVRISILGALPASMHPLPESAGTAADE